MSAPTQAKLITHGNRETIIRTATIDGAYRYDLRHIWRSGKSLTVIGLNPSTANELSDDHTIRVLTNYSKRLGFGSLLMLNLFAWKATRPRDLIKASKNGADVIGEFNTFEQLRTKIFQSDCQYVFAAWGKYGKQRGREFAAFMGYEWCFHTLKAFAVNKDGSPHHPLHLKMYGTISPYFSKDWFSTEK